MHDSRGPMVHLGHGVHIQTGHGNCLIKQEIKLLEEVKDVLKDIKDKM